MKFQAGSSAIISETEMRVDREALANYATYIRERGDSGETLVPESALSLSVLSESQSFAKDAVALLGKPRYVFLIGIGGSSLGVEAVYGALFGQKIDRDPSLYVFDTISAQRIASLEQFLQVEKPSISECAIIIASKSGNTTETIVNATLVLDIFCRRYTSKDVYRRVVVISDAKSPLAEFAQKNACLFFGLPEAIGGRYSVFTAVGVVPLALLGIDTTAMLLGAEDCIRHECTEGSTDAMDSASVTYRHGMQGFHILDTFTFAPQLLEYGRWYRQLFAESIGKKTDKEGKAVPCMLVPTVSTAVDLHSMAQLYLSGDRGIYTQFHVVTKDANERVVPHEVPVESLESSLSGVSTQYVMHAIEDGVMEAYREQKLPYSTFTLDEVNSYELGSLMAFRMLETIYVAELMHVNAFDQPQVELYKKNTRRILG